MTNERYDPARGWVPAEPLGYIGDGPDFEVMRRNDGSRHWCGYSRDRLLDSGDAQTRLGLTIALWRARRRLRRQIVRETR